MMRQTTRCAEIARFADTCFAAAGGVGLWRGEFATAQGETTAMSEDQAMARCEDQVNDSAMCDFSSGDCTSGERRCTVEASGCSPDKVIASMNPAGRLSGQASASAANTKPSGQERDRVRKIQRRLFLKGHSPGALDGVMGANTREAIKSWQRSQGEDVTGVFTPSQEAMLTYEPPVDSIQWALRSKGFDPGPIDGVMGDRTRDAIQQCQSSRMEAGTGVLTRLQEHELTGCPPGTDGCYSWDR